MIGGLRELIRKIKNDCTRCRSRNKKFVEVEIGTYLAAKTKIAPSFYNSMIDIAFGFVGQPFKWSRTKLKLYSLVFGFVLTGATYIQVLEG